MSDDRNIFERTRISLEGRWTKGSTEWVNGRTCILGHYVEADKELRKRAVMWNRSAMAVVLNQVIEELFPDRVDHSGSEPWASYTSFIEISRFNDHPKTTELDVLRVLRAAQERI